jgi:hypothetical protein
VRTLADICREHCFTDIHFLKVDVDGAEAYVLRGADFRAFRPWIVLVEAKQQASTVESWRAWEVLLTGAEYRFIWFDGLNRFYIAAERWDALRHAFVAPPNVFDQWIQPRGREQRALLERCQAVANAALNEANATRAALTAAQATAADARARLAAVQAAVATAQAEAAEARAALAALETERCNQVRKLHDELAAAQIGQAHVEDSTAAMLRSTSWRLTAAIRGVRRFSRSAITLGRLSSGTGRWARLQRVAGPGQIRVKGMARICFYGFSRLVMRQPGSTVMCAVALRLLPGSYKWLRAHYHAYLDSALHAIPPSSPRLVFPPDRELRSAEGLQPFSLPAEEYRMLIRLRAQRGTA